LECYTKNHLSEKYAQGGVLAAVLGGESKKLKKKILKFPVQVFGFVSTKKEGEI